MKVAFRLVASAIIVLALAIGGYTLIRSQPSTCVAGLQGAAVSVTVDGPTADSQCQSLAGQVTDGGGWYVYQSGTVPGGAVICQYNVSGDTLTVRDQGVANLYGTSVCEFIHGLATRATYVAPTDVPIAEAPVVIDDEDTSNGGYVEGPTGYDEACTLALANANLRVFVTGNAGLCDTVKGQILSIGVFEETDGLTPDVDRIICSGVFINGLLDVYDSGGAMYGTRVCQLYGFVSP